MASLVTSPKAKPSSRHCSRDRSGKRSCSAWGRMIAPDRLCPPQVLAFSMTATGTSPRRSIVSGSSASSWSSRLAVARPAVPPPTIATPTSMRSSSASSSRLMNSFCVSTGGGYAAGTTRPLPFAAAIVLALAGLHRLGELGEDLVEVADDPEVGELEDRGVRVLVDRHDVLRGLHADLVLDRAGDARREVQLRRDGLARLADLRRVRVRAGVDDRAGRGDGAVAAERLGQLLELVEALGLAEPATAGDEDVGVLDVDVGAALLAALEHLGLGRPWRELDLDGLDLGGVARGLGDLERVEAADDDAARLVLGLGDRAVAEDRALGDELAVLDGDVGDLHGHARVQARGEAGADLEAEQAAAEQRVVVPVVLHDLGHGVDDRLRQALGPVDVVDLRSAVAAELRGEVVGDRVAEDEHLGLRAELAGELRGLGDGAEGVLVELALVVQGVRENPGHLDQLPLVEPRHDLLDGLVRVLVLDDGAGRLLGRLLEVAAVDLRALGADLRRVEAGVAGADLLERLLLGAHDRLQRRVARFVDGVADGDDGGQVDLDGVVAVLGLALAAQAAVRDVHLDDLRQRGHLDVVGDDRAD